MREQEQIRLTYLASVSGKHRIITQGACISKALCVPDLITRRGFKPGDFHEDDFLWR